jgi:hypothetical protein
VKKDPLSTTDPRTAATNEATNLAFFQKACMSWGNAGAAPLSFDLKSEGDGLDRGVLRGLSAGEEVSVCHRGRATIVHFSAKLTAADCSSLMTQTANYSGDGRISCDNGLAFGGYFFTESTVRFGGKVSWGVVGK